jgi:Gas vesicle synthesis protein GvpL/GvpF
MSEVYVHAVTAASASDAVEAAGARAMVHRGLAAIATDAAAAGIKATELMRRHWRLLEAVAETATVLPVRFGTAMAGEEAVVSEFLAPRHDDLAAQLAALDGKVQLTVKGTYDEEALLRSIVSASPQVAALRERVRATPGAAGHFHRIQLGELVAAEVEQSRARDAAWVLERLQGLAVATSSEPAGGTDGAVNAAFLVARERGEEFARAFETAAAELAGRVELRLLGPMPPYSFASEQIDGAPAWA